MEIGPRELIETDDFLGLEVYSRMINGKEFQFDVVRAPYGTTLTITAYSSGNDRLHRWVK